MAWYCRRSSSVHLPVRLHRFIKELDSVCSIVGIILFLDKFEEVGRSFYICRNEVSVLHVAWIDVSEIRIGSQAAKVEVNPNGCMITFAVRWSNDVGFVDKWSKSAADGDQINLFGT